MNIIEWLKDGWVLLAAVIGGITLLWNFSHKTLNEIKIVLNKPITQINEKVDSITLKLENIDKNAGIRKRALLTIQRKSILDSCTKYLKRGYISIEEKETLYEQVESYNELGGNSFVKDLVKKLDSLPLEKPQKENKE